MNGETPCLAVSVLFFPLHIQALVEASCRNRAFLVGSKSGLVLNPSLDE